METNLTLFTLTIVPFNISFYPIKITMNYCSNEVNVCIKIKQLVFFIKIGQPNYQVTIKIVRRCTTVIL